MTIRRQGSRALTPAQEQEQAYLLLCACADRLRNNDLAAVDVMHAQACTMDARHDGVPVVVTAAYDLVETIPRNEVVDADGQCTYWLAAALRAFNIRNTVSRAMLIHSLLTLDSHPLVTAHAHQQIRTQFGVRRAEARCRPRMPGCGWTPRIRCTRCGSPPGGCAARWPQSIP